MFNLIGADGKNYGPVSAEQFRQWLREGRVNGHTQVQAVGRAEWQAAATVPEFAGTLGSPPPGTPPMLYPSAPAVTHRAQNKVAAGVCGIMLGGMGVHKFILGYTGAGLTMLLVNILTCGIGGIVMHIIGLIEGIIYLTKTDEEFVRVYVDGRKEWF